ncbi:MAG: polysaccharide biosynthesis C-terminal domain-containing protein [Bacteroidota bacterium]
MISLGNARVRAGQIAQGLRQLTLISLALWLPRSGIGLEAIGWWEQMQYLGFLLGFSWLVGLEQAYLVQLKDKNKAVADQFTGQAFALIAGIAVAILLTGWLAAGPLLQMLTGDHELPGWPFYLCFLAAHWPGLFTEKVLLARSKPERLLTYSFITNLALLSAIVIPLSTGSSFAEAIRWLVPVALLKIILSVAFLRTSMVFKDLDFTGLKPWLILAGPLILYSALNSINYSFDAWFVNFWYEGDGDTFALFRYGTREIPLLAAATGGIIQATLPILGDHQGLEQLKKSSLRLMHLFYPGAALLLLSSPWWWTIVFTERLADSLPIFQLFLLIGISRMLFPISVLTARGLERQLLWIGLIEIAINAVLSVILVQYMGLIGIVWATVITYLLDKLIAVYWLWRAKGIPLSDYCAWKWWVGYSVGLVGVWLIA